VIFNQDKSLKTNTHFSDLPKQNADNYHHARKIEPEDGTIFDGSRFNTNADREIITNAKKET